VLTTYPRTVPGAVESILRIGRVLDREPQAAALAREITLSVSGIEAASRLEQSCGCACSARFGKSVDDLQRDTYAHDVLRMLGFNNVYAAAGRALPAPTVEEAVEHRPDIVAAGYEPCMSSARATSKSLKAMLDRRRWDAGVLISGRDLPLVTAYTWSKGCARSTSGSRGCARR